jgi:hypothetical protein
LLFNAAAATTNPGRPPCGAAAVMERIAIHESPRRRRLSSSVATSRETRGTTIQAGVNPGACTTSFSWVMWNGLELMNHDLAVVR